MIIWSWPNRECFRRWLVGYGDVRIWDKRQPWHQFKVLVWVGKGMVLAGLHTGVLTGTSMIYGLMMQVEIEFALAK